MQVLNQGGSSSISNPVLVFSHIQKNQTDGVGDGLVVDVDALSYRVLTPAGAEYIASTPVNTTTEKLGTGRYAPAITLSGGETVGEYWQVEWTVTPVAAGPSYTAYTYFEVVPAGQPIPDGYCTVQGMRDEGVPVTFADARVAAAIRHASGLVERITRRFFEPRYLVVERDGRGSGVLAQFDDPIIGVVSVHTVSTGLTTETNTFDASDLVIYNRHMRGLLHPDDRDNPMITFRGEEANMFAAMFGRTVRQARQNVVVEGWWGYTQPDGSILGKTPDDIVWAVKALAMKRLRPMFKTHGTGTYVSGPVVKESTRDQSVAYVVPMTGSTKGAILTGDVEIDNILSMYVGPMPMVSV